MAYTIDFAEIRTYFHSYRIDTDDELEAQKIAEELANSSDFLCDIVGNGSYYGTELEVSDVYKYNDEHIKTLTDAEIAEYTEG